jgi:hypothetical protein
MRVLQAHRRVAVLSITVALVALGCSAASSGARRIAPKPPVCSGTLRSPGVLAGSYRSGVLVRGTCFVNAGAVTVHGKLEVGAGASLLAAFGLNHRTHRGGSSIVVLGNVFVDRGGTLVLGCSNMSEVPCRDLPNKFSTISSSDRISGNVTAQQALGVVLHDTTVGGGILQTGGGGGPGCGETGVFKLLPNLVVYSDYEDASVGRSLTITNVNSCWLGVAREHIRGNLILSHDKLSNPDAIEILANNVGGNLSCSRSTHLFDTADTGQTFWPRRLERNTVHGKRQGQCMINSPTAQGGKPGPGPF